MRKQSTFALLRFSFRAVSGEYATTSSRDKISVRLVQEKAAIPTQWLIRLTNRRRSASAQRMTLTLYLGGPKNQVRILGPCLARASLRRPVFTSPGVDARLALNLRYPASA